MVFSEPTFLFFFLPICLGLYFFLPEAWRNPFLLIASLGFYAWGEAKNIHVLLLCIGLNYGFGLLIARAMERGRGASGLLALGIGLNLGFLAIYKYLGFLLDNLGVPNAYAIAPALPLGISFFTFQAMSYLIDIRRGEVVVQRSLFHFALFKSLFPQLIAGPIVRYAEIKAELNNRRLVSDDMAEGIGRFVKGLAKKTLIADPMGLTADRIFAIPAGGLSPETAWLGTITYALQIYFDFSAYSDMAIGLGRFFGFHFPENFDHPYAARSVTEFWRRWHMTLSRWFRDYLYIPLGGNRKGAGRTYLNLAIVFLATGLWHGAAWTFVFWGAWHGTFLILERLFLTKWLRRAPGIVSHVYTLGAVLFGWIPFRASDFSQATDFWSSLVLGTHGAQAAFYPLARYADSYILTVMVAGIAFAAPLSRWLSAQAHAVLPAQVDGLARAATHWVLFVVALVSVGAASYSPFIYFRF